MSKVKILVVEDEIIIADNICMILEDLGYEVAEPAINYEEAVETIAEFQPDLAILDIQLAGKKDGIDLAWHIKENHHFPFIFLTSNADPATVERAKKVMPPAYLVKPFNQDDLFTSLEMALHNFAHQEIKPNTASENVVIQDAFFVKVKDLFHKVKFTDIMYLKSEHVYVEVHTSDNKKYLIRGTLTEIVKKLPKNFGS